MTSRDTIAPSRTRLNKVPEVTVWFWVIKVLCTTVGETAADFLNVNLNLGLTGTSLVTGVLLVVALIFQFRLDRYVPGMYWTAVTLVSVFGTLVTDNLSDLGVPLETSTVVFSVAVALTFLGWYSSERTLSIHSIVTLRREAFYWLAILFTFALGTATGDLMAEVLGLGYAVTGLIVASLIVLFAIGWRLGLHPVLAFWAIYVLTRPLGASIGDFLSQPSDQGGLGLGATVTSAIFLAGILGIVAYLAMSRADVIEKDAADAGGADADTGDVDLRSERGGLWQTVVVVVLIVAAAGTGYAVRKAALQNDAASSVSAAAPATAGGPAALAGGSAAPISPLGDLSPFRTITQDTLDKLDAGDQAGATSRVDDLETSWDNAQARLKARDDAAWTTVDDKIDTVLRELRATSPDPTTERAALTDLLGSLG